MKIINLFLAIFLFYASSFSLNILIISPAQFQTDPEIRDIATLPFENQGNADTDWISSGLEYLLNNKLSILTDLNIIDKNSTQMAFYKLSLNNGDFDSGKSSNQIDRLPISPLIISGTYFKSPSQLEFKILFHDAESGQLLKREEISDSNLDIFKITHKIVQQILNTSGVTASATEKSMMARPLTTNPIAFESFIKAIVESKKQNPNENLVLGLFKEAIAKDENFWEAYYNLGILYFNKKQYDQALNQFNTIISSLPEFDKPYYSRGLIYEKLKNHDLALKDFKKVIEINPDDPTAYVAVAKIDILKGDLVEAKINIDTSLAINPDFAPAHFEYGNYYIAQNQIIEAIPEYQMAVEFDPDNNQYRQTLAETYYRNKRYYNAQYEFQTILESEPNNADANFMLGLTIYKQAVLEEIVDTFMDMLDINIEDVSADTKTSNTAKTRDAAKKREFFVEIIDAYTKAAQSRPQFIQATFNLALVYLEQENFKQAENYFKATLLIDPTLIPAHDKLAEVYEKTNRRHLAIEQYKKIFYLDPSIFVEKPTLGPVHHYISILDICMDDLDKKIKNDPDDAKTNIVLAKLFRAQGYISKATNVLKSILAKNPQNREARILLGSIEKGI